MQSPDPVTMEISSSPPLPDLERENLVGCRSQDREELYPDTHELQEPIKDKQEGKEAEEGGNGETNGDECDYLVFEIGQQEERQETGEREEQENEGGDGGGRGRTEGQGEEKVQADDGSKGQSIDLKRGQIEEGDEGGVKKVSKDEGIRDTQARVGGRGDSKEEDEWVGKRNGEMKAEALADLLFLSDHPVGPSSSEPRIVFSQPSEQPAANMSQDAWGHDPGNQDDLSDCLQAELAIVYSDSDAGDDQWAGFAPCNVTNQEEAGRGICDSICEVKNKEEHRGENEERGGEEDEAEEQREEQVQKRQGEMRGSRDTYDEEQMRMRRDVFLRSPSVSSTASSTEPDGRVRLNLASVLNMVSVCFICTLKEKC